MSYPDDPFNSVKVDFEGSPEGGPPVSPEVRESAGGGGTDSQDPEREGVEQTDLNALVKDITAGKKGPGPLAGKNLTHHDLHFVRPRQEEAARNEAETQANFVAAYNEHQKKLENEGDSEIEQDDPDGQ